MEEEEENPTKQKSSSWFGGGKSKEFTGKNYFLEIRRGPIALLSLCTENQKIRDQWNSAVQACLRDIRHRSKVSPTPSPKVGPPKVNSSYPVAPPKGGPPRGAGPPRGQPLAQPKGGPPRT
jgi:hypothetical protein